MGKSASMFYGNGIMINHKGKNIALDPNRNTDADLVFVSHAHMDHLHMPSRNENLLVSNETAKIASARGYSISDFRESFDNHELIDSGHILGSRALLIDDTILYTGDVCTRDRAFLKGANLPKCETLILESTYGKPEYRFPSIAQILDQVNRLISDLYSKGTPVILLGYPLGKAQVLTSMFKHWGPIYLHDSVQKMNLVYNELGIDLGDGVSYWDAEEKDLLRKKPWLMVAPRASLRSSLISEVRERYGAVTMGFSGWALNGWYSYSSDLDYSFPLSDHCDFDELISIVKTCAPSKVYTFHGFAIELASYLKKIGYDAEPLIKGNYRLSDFQ